MIDDSESIIYDAEEWLKNHYQPSIIFYKFTQNGQVSAKE